MFSDKVVVITGASSGIGAMLVKKLCNAGAIVVGLARRMYKMEELLNEVPEDSFHPRLCDMSKEKDIAEAIAWTVSKFATIDILINNAGVCQLSSLVDGNTSKWKEMIDVNILGMCIATREVLRCMRFSDKGHIINVNSIAGHIVPKFKNCPIGLYSATKHAVSVITESLRSELEDKGSQIKVSSVSPSLVYTEMHLKINGERDVPNVPGDITPPQNFLNADDVANSIISILTSPPNIQVTDLKIQTVAGNEFCPDECCLTMPESRQ